MTESSDTPVPDLVVLREAIASGDPVRAMPVSYTHLTLPTTVIV